MVPLACNAPFGFKNSVNVKQLRFMPLAEQKQGILLLQQMGFSRLQILRQTGLFSEEYDAALNAPPFALSYRDF